MKITKETLEEIVRECETYRDVCRKLNVKPVGGNITSIKKACIRYEVDTSHFTSKSWAKGKRLFNNTHPKTKYTSVDDIFQYGTHSTKAKPILIEERGRQCERCGNVEWLGQPITLELEHKDGDNKNNIKSNLELLCPNCHSYTMTWKGRNNKTKRITDADFVRALEECDDIAKALKQLGLTPKGANYKRANVLLTKMTEKQQEQQKEEKFEENISPFNKEELEDLLWKYPTTTIAEMYNMSDNGVSRWAKKWKLEKPPRGYWQRLHRR